MHKTQTINVAYDRVKFIAIIFCMSKYMFLWPWDHATHWHRGVPCVYRTSQRNWVTIKVLYRYLRGCLLSWHGSRLGFVTPSIEGVSLGPLGNTRHNKLASKVTKELVTRWCITERVNRLASNDIELGMKIQTIESRASNILIDKGTNVCCHKVRPVKIFVEYVGTNIGIQVPLLVIDRRSISVMST